MNQTINSLLPKKLKVALRKIVNKKYWSAGYTDLYNEFKLIFQKEREKIERQIPKADLQQKHIKNLRMLLNRNDLLMELPKNATCAEIGVDQGEFSEQILKVTQPKKLHLVDAWGDESRYHDGLKLQVAEKFAKEIKADKVEINIGFSHVVLKNMPDSYFDWVYLDTDHSYNTTARELNILNKKVKPGGIICGHDYNMGNWVGNIRYGVIEAVHEFCLNYNWELIYITINEREMPSFAIRLRNSLNP